MLMMMSATAHQMTTVMTCVIILTGLSRTLAIFSYTRLMPLMKADTSRAMATTIQMSSIRLMVAMCSHFIGERPGAEYDGIISRPGG